MCDYFLRIIAQGMDAGEECTHLVSESGNVLFRLRLLLLNEGFALYMIIW